MFVRAVWLALAIVVGLGSPAAAQRPRDVPSFERPRDVYPQLYRGDPTVELITMGVGGLIWERHGHIAVCLSYVNRRQDMCYNYGIGDFHKPLSMAAGFFRGTKSFWAGEQRVENMYATYIYADRTVWVQPLPLTAEQTAHVVASLERDVLPEHRHYAYDHFWDNCTTRVRDVLDEATGGALRAMTRPSDGRTYRDLAREGFFGMRVPLLVTDLAMGRSTDRVPTYYERMFLPDYMREAAQELWGVTPIVVYERQGPPSLKDGPSGRLILLLVILVLTAPAWATRLWGRVQRAGLALAVVPYVLFGSILWFLAVISPLSYVRWNETCLVLLPTDLLLLGFLAPAARRLYARARVGMLALLALLMLVGVLTQPIWPALFWPLIPAAVVGFWPARKT
jgi:hypothetical protein